MLIDYLDAAMEQASYEKIEGDQPYYGVAPGLAGGAAGGGASAIAPSVGTSTSGSAHRQWSRNAGRRTVQ